MKLLKVFTSKTCNPCQIQKNIIEQAKLDIEVEYIDVYENPEIPSEHGVYTTPTIILYEKGEEVKRSIEVVEGIKEFVGVK